MFRLRTAGPLTLDETVSDPAGFVVDIPKLLGSPGQFNPAVDPPEAEGLKGDQLSAFREVTARIAMGQQIVKLCGFAGTGKTFLLARIAKWAVRTGFQTSISAPTHKAAGVIKDKLGDETIPVRTIHSLLGLRLQPDFTNDSGGRILQAADSKSKVKQGLVICDEGSMVGSVLKEHIDRTPGVTWLFVGDLAQLPPVGETVSELLDDPDATLEQVLRQAQGSEILNLATRIRQGDLSMDFNTGMDVSRVDDAEQMFQAALHRFSSDEYKKDPSHARMLVFRNQRRESLNRRMRRLLIGADEPYTAGEWLVMYAQFAPEKSRLNVLAGRAKQFKKGDYGYGRAWRDFFQYKESVGSAVTQLHVSEEVLVEWADTGTVAIGPQTFDIWRLSVKTRTGRSFELPVLQEQEQEKYRELMMKQVEEAQQCKLARDEHSPGSSEWVRLDEARKKAWGVYFTLEETFAQVDYSYAMTVHKSQGSTFDHAFVDVPDLLGSGDMVQRILYTACTRSAKSLTFYL
jgi:exodeoxyribonuclease-5